jgi:NACHT domain
MEHDDLRRWLWDDPTAASPRSPAKVLRDIEIEHVSSVWNEHRQADVRVLRQSAESPVDPEVIPRRVEEPSRCTLQELLSRQERVLVVGGRGTGKTALISRLAARIAVDRSASTQALVPFVVPVSLLSEPQLNEDTIARLSPLGGILLVRRALLERRALVLVDGLDEAGDGTRTLSESIAAFGRAHPGNRMVVTTRPRRTGIPGYTRVELSGFVTATLVPPPGDRVYAAHRFLWRRFPERRVSLVADKVTVLLRVAAGEAPPVAAGEAPPARSVLGALDMSEQRILFGAVAFDMHLRQLVEIPLEKLAESLRERLRGARWVDGKRLVLDEEAEDPQDDDSDEDDDSDDGDFEDESDEEAEDDEALDDDEAPEDADDTAAPVHEDREGLVEREGELVQDTDGLVARLIAEIRRQRGLLIERRPGFFSFAELAYQDYLNAQEYIRIGALKELVQMREDAWWQDTLVFAAGAEGVDRAAFIQQILDADLGSAPVATLIAARCAEVAGPLPPRLRQTISRRLSELLPPRNELNVAHLLALGDVVGPALLQALGSAAPRERAYTAIVLGNLGYRPAYGALLRMVADTTPVQGSITCRIWTEDLIAKNKPVGYFALVALFDASLASTSGRRIFEQALAHVPPRALDHFHTLIDHSYLVNQSSDMDLSDRDAEVVRVLLMKMRRVLERNVTGPPPRAPRWR